MGTGRVLNEEFSQKLVHFCPFSGDYDELSRLAERCRAVEVRLSDRRAGIRIGVDSPAMSPEQLRASYEDAQLVVRLQEISENEEKNICSSIKYFWRSWQFICPMSFAAGS